MAESQVGVGHVVGPLELDPAEDGLIVGEVNQLGGEEHGEADHSEDGQNEAGDLHHPVVQPRVPDEAVDGGPFAGD